MLLTLASCGAQVEPESGYRGWLAGFGKCEISLDGIELESLNIAGYRGGRAPVGVLDLQEARALVLSAGMSKILLISVDCVALDTGIVGEIRSRLRGLDVASVNVVATHTHAGADTLGLWGDAGVDGKNRDFTERLIEAAVKASEDALGDLRAGKLAYGTVATEGLQKDSREPEIYDTSLYSLRFEPDDGSAGIRLVSFAAHAEALRGDNLLISRDYPGLLCDLIEAESGDRALFVPGAIGGLIMTPEFDENRVESLRITAERLADYALEIDHSRELEPTLRAVRVTFETELENTLFICYKFLGILGSSLERRPLGGYTLTSELTLVRVGDVTLGLMPGEVFPELVLGEGGFNELAAEYGTELVTVGLANDELGYVMPASDFAVHPEFPYILEAEGDHYEETNSVGIGVASALRGALETALTQLYGG